MAQVIFNLPDEVVLYIETELNQKIDTYIQNEFVKLIIKGYKEYLTEKKVEQAKTDASAEVDSVKDNLRVQLKK